MNNAAANAFVMERFRDRLGRGLLLAPVVFVAHWIEENPGFVAWFNAHVTPGITQESFGTVNTVALVITVLVTLGYWAAQSPALALIAVAWLSFLMLTNAIFHIAGAIVDRAYVPGLTTAIVLYLPYSVWVAVQVARGRRVTASQLVAAAVLGGTPMAVHGYRILFLGNRLF